MTRNAIMVFGMRKVTYPTRVTLSEIPLEGRTYHFSKDSGELNESLKDLIGDHDYQVEITLRPLGNVFEISGLIKTNRDISCSRCARDIKQAINKPFTELIVIEDDRPRKTRSGHVSNESLASGPYCNYVKSEVFSLTDFIHEQIATEETFLVECGLPDCEDLLSQYQGELPPENEKNNPFAVLKNLKPKH